MAAEVVQTADKRWLATANQIEADGDSPEEASDNLADTIKAQS